MTTETTLQIFEFGDKGRLFVSGLFWQPLPGMAPTVRKAEIEKIAKEQNFDLMVVRTGANPQVGFCSSTDMGKAGLLSAAAVISETVEMEGGDRNVLCATEVSKDQWLYVAQRSGVILYDGDQLGTEDEIRIRMLADLSTSEWELIYAPSHWQVQNAKERNKFEDFFPKKGDKLAFKKWWAVRPVKSSIKDLKAYLPALLIAIVLIAIFTGYMQWKKWRTVQELAQFMAQQSADAAATANHVQRLEHPWKTIPGAAAFTVACNTALNNIPFLFPGSWSLSDILCKGETLALNWTRADGGTIADLRAIVPGAVIYGAGSSATFSVPLGPISSADEKVPVQQARMGELYNLAQIHHQNLTLAEAAPLPVLPGQKQVFRDWKEVVWSVNDSTLPPEILVPLFDGDGFRVGSIQTKIIDGVMRWNIEGVQYVQP
ncbi:type 4b pilus protein PilO2 [Glaciimonas sp. GG7]